MTNNLACIIFNHKWVEPKGQTVRIQLRGDEGETRIDQKLMAVCARDNCDAKVWDYVGPDAA